MNDDDMPPFTKRSYVFDPYDDPEEQTYEYMAVDLYGPPRRRDDLIAPEQAKGVYYVPQGRRTLVYRAFDIFDHLLYVGMTRELCARMAAHKRESPWWSQVHRIEWELFGSRSAAQDEEKRLIQQLLPRFNTMCMPEGRRYRQKPA